MKALGPYDAPTVVTHGPACSAVPGPGPELPADAFTSMPAAYASRKASSTGSENGSAPPLIEKLKTQPGFLYHVAFVDEGGSFTVSEIWETKEQHDRWFSENVEGVIPGIEQQVIKVHAVVTP
jgi:hypothetical protein